MSKNIIFLEGYLGRLNSYPDVRDCTWMNVDHEYYLNIAKAVRKKANCKGRRVGAVFVKENRIITTGYNGTPENMDNCKDGGCVRCAEKEKYKESHGYDVCICVHAEQNALMCSARFGIPVAGAFAYSTLQPCFGCVKTMLQADVAAVYYIHPWKIEDNDALATQYNLIKMKFKSGMHQIGIMDEDADWANGKMDDLPTEKNGETPKAPACRTRLS